MSRKLTRHHVPPTSTARGRTQFILWKSDYEHRAYHILFWNLGSLTECVTQLYQYTSNPECMRTNKLEAFQVIFGDKRRFTDCIEILQKNWWTNTKEVSSADQGNPKTARSGRL